MKVEKIPTKVKFDFEIKDELLTKDKIYEVIEGTYSKYPDGIGSFHISDDNDQLTICLTKGCAQLEGQGEWTIVEYKTNES